MINSAEKKRLRKAKYKSHFVRIYKKIRDKWHARLLQDINTLQSSVNRANAQSNEIKNILAGLSKRLEGIETQQQELAELNKDHSSKLSSQCWEFAELNKSQFSKFSSYHQELIEQGKNQIDNFDKFTEQNKNQFLKLSLYFEKSPYYNDYYTTFKGSYGSIGVDEINHLIKNYEFETVLDIGSGTGHHSKIFVENNKKVTAIDIGNSVYYHDREELEQSDFVQVLGDYNTHNFTQQFDCIWCCMVLEHQHNVGLFLNKVHSDLKENGVLAIIVPPLKSMIVGGHVSLWNAGLLLYNLVITGFDCHDASVWSHNYDICVIVRKKSINVLGELTHDFGDIKTISKYLPLKLEWHLNDGDAPFNGVIEKLNWED